MAGPYTRDQLADILSLYNKPNLLPSKNPNRKRYADMLALAPSMLPSEPQPEPGAVIFEAFRDPEPAGTFAAMPRGVVLHGSRSGKPGNPKATEYLGTARYEVNNNVGLGWHATVGENVVAVHLEPTEWGWHALQASKVYLGVEFAQATVDEPITDAQVDAFVAWFTQRVLTIYPNIPWHFLSHAEVDQEFNTNQGKSDAFPLGDVRMDDLRARIMARLQPQPVPEPVPEPEPPAPPEPPAMTLAEIRARLETIQAEIAALLAQLPAA